MEKILIYGLQSVSNTEKKGLQIVNVKIKQTKEQTGSFNRKSSVKD